MSYKKNNIIMNMTELDRQTHTHYRDRGRERERERELLCCERVIYARAELSIVFLTASLQPLKLQSTCAVLTILINMHLKLDALAPEIDCVSSLVHMADVQFACHLAQLTQHSTNRTLTSKLKLHAGGPVAIGTLSTFGGGQVLSVLM